MPRPVRSAAVPAPRLAVARRWSELFGYTHGTSIIARQYADGRCRSPTRMTLLLRPGDPPVPPLQTWPIRPVRRDLRPVLHSVARPCRGVPAERFARCQALRHRLQATSATTTA